MDRKVSQTTKLAEENKRQIDYLVQERDSMSTKVEEQDRRISQLEEQIEDQINRNTRNTLVFRGIKRKNSEKTWNDTENVLANTLFVVTLAGSKISLYMTPTESIEEHIKTLIYLYTSNICHGKLPKMWWPASFLQISGKLNIFASQKYSKKIQDKMNSQLLKRKEFKQDEDKKLWKSYDKFPGVLMVKKPGDHRYQI